MTSSYLDYAMSVIVSRALPDVRDGLKPVHRRILYGMKTGGYDSSKPYKKSARIVGDVMGQYHPHGDAAIYDALVRMAQDFSMRVPLVNGQGNFGSVDGDRAAAMRYTEARLQKSAEYLLMDIDRDTVDFQPNYDETQQEPKVLPARFPNLLVNGAGGIAVGMATNIPPHNPREVIEGCIALLENPEMSVDDLMEIIPGPDFPTGGIILGLNGRRAAYSLGRGSIIVKARCEITTIRKDRQAIIVTEIPYQVNKARLIERIAEQVRDKVVEGISDLRDESDRDGMRIVIELKRDATSEVVLNQLYRHTPLRSSFGANIVALRDGRPEVLTLKDILTAFLNFREEVIYRRAAFDLRKARDRAHTWIGLAVAVANIDQIVALIRGASDPGTAREALLSEVWDSREIASLIRTVDDPFSVLDEHDGYKLTEAQAKAILDLRLHRLTGLERSKIAEELQTLVVAITDLLEILSSRTRLLDVLRTELMDFHDAHNTPRRTGFEDAEHEHDIEDLLEREDMVVTVSHTGYVKRVPLVTYRAQRRGGKGRTGMSTRDDDFVEHLFVANTHTAMLFFTTKGIVHKIKTYKLPLGSPQARGRALVNVLPIEQGERISAVLSLPDSEDEAEQLFVMFATASGTIRRNRLSDFTTVKANGKIAMKLNEGDYLISVQVCTEDQDLLLATHHGKAIRFGCGDIRVFQGRDSIGVRAIRLAEGDTVIGMTILNSTQGGAVDSALREAYLKAANRRRDTSDADVSDLLSQEDFERLQDAEQFLLTITAQGYGKRVSSHAYRVSGRGGQGIWNIEPSDQGADGTRVVACFKVDNEDIMMVTGGGQIIRSPVGEISAIGRRARGVRVFRLAEDEKVVSAAPLAVSLEDDLEIDLDTSSAPDLVSEPPES